MTAGQSVVSQPAPWCVRLNSLSAVGWLGLYIAAATTTTVSALLVLPITY